MDENTQFEGTQATTPGWLTPVIVVLGIVSIAGVGFGWHSSSKLNEAQAAFTAQMETMKQDTAQQIAALQQQQEQAMTKSANLESDLGVVTQRLRVTQTELNRARAEAAKIREESAQQLAELGTNVETKLATKASAEELSTVNGTVNVVKTDLETTKNELKLARSELGTLIARNHEEIDALRRLGEREYIEFTIAGRKKPQKVGNITVELRSADTKNQRYTVRLVVDDVQTEKKNLVINEPVFFYPRGTRQAEEFVVNSVSKDQISGYISIPKRTASTTTAASGN